MNVNEFIDAVESEIMKFPNASERFSFSGQFDPASEFGPCVELLLESRILNAHTRLWVRQEDIDHADPKDVAEYMRDSMRRYVSEMCSFGAEEYF